MVTVMSDYGYFRLSECLMTRLRQWLKISKIKRCHKQRHGLYHYGSSQWAPVNESESVEQRRQNIIEKRRRRNAMNPARIEEIISAMTGTDVRIDEYYGKNRFAIYLSSIPSLVDELSVRKKLKVIKQSHKVFDIFL